MGELTIGRQRIPYSVRISTRAKNRRIEVTPDGVVLVVPKGQDIEDAEVFLMDRRGWVYEKVLAVGAKVAHRDTFRPERLVSGAKVLYRGRRMRLTVRTHDGPEIKIEYRNGFLLHAPTTATDHDKRSAMIAWLKDRVREDIRSLVRRYANRLDVQPRAVRVLGLERIWGSCGSGGILHFDWRLVFAPKPVLEYAVLHEICHMKERTHSPAFWGHVGSQMPDYEDRKAWLDSYQHLLDALPL